MIYFTSANRELKAISGGIIILLILLLLVILIRKYGNKGVGECGYKGLGVCTICIVFSLRSAVGCSVVNFLY